MQATLARGQDLPPLKDDEKGMINGAFREMKQSLEMTTFLKRLQQQLEKEVLGHQTILKAIEQYQCLQAEQNEKKEERKFNIGSMQNLRCFIEIGSSWASHEDPMEFIEGIFKRKFDKSDPDLFFQTTDFKKYAVYPLDEEDKTVKIKELKKIKGPDGKETEVEVSKTREEMLQDGFEVHQAALLTNKDDDKMVAFDPDKPWRTGGAKETCYLQLFPMLLPQEQVVQGQSLLEAKLNEHHFPPRQDKSDLAKYLVNDRPTYVIPTTEYTQMTGAPECLILKMEPWQNGEKTFLPVDMPEVIKINETHYRKNAFVVHLGSTGSSGHYVAYVVKREAMKPDKWWFLNDSSVMYSPTQPKTPYLCIYEKFVPAAALEQPLQES
jgi:hypothetical protein